MNLICPNCGSTELVYSGTTAVGAKSGYGATDQRYTCKNCGYAGPLVIDVEKEENAGGGFGFPVTAILAVFLFVMVSYALGASPDWCASFFCASAVLVFAFYYLLRSAGGESVENDLKNLDDSGLPRDRV